jgi:hypothetical protein
MSSASRGQLEQPPVDVGEAAQEFAHFEVVGSHGSDLGNQVFADVFGDGLLVHLGGEVVAALGRVFVERALEEVQGIGELAGELFLAEEQEVMLFAHKYAYTYAYFKASQSANQEENVKRSEKKRGEELNCYL